MITRIKGKNITNFYSVQANKTIKTVDDEQTTIYTSRPELIKESKVEWQEMFNFEGDLHYSDAPYWGICKYIHISEDERVRIEDTKFRADLNEKHAFIDKVICELDNYESKSNAETIFNEELENFNKAMINSNDTMLAYCKLHHLPPEGTDCIELFKLIYPGETYEIVDGKMKKKEISKYEVSGWAIDESALATISPSYSSKICALESSVATITCLNGDAITMKA